MPELVSTGRGRTDVAVQDTVTHHDPMPQQKKMREFCINQTKPALTSTICESTEQSHTFNLWLNYNSQLLKCSWVPGNKQQCGHGEVN